MQARFDLIGFVVADMARSLAFYRALGMEIPAEADQQPHVDIELPGGPRFAWDTVEVIRSFDPDWQPSTGGPGVSIAFRVDTPADVDAAYKQLTAAGYDGHKEPWDAFWGQRYATLRDPDGYGVDLFCPSR
ncbi:MAG TPA: VOC family protein [Mycobacteriales bacterium]|nr:VOC family protein [Mycobacteriales bacterium]